MADFWNREKRSAVMAKIRSRGNKSTELRLLAIFRKYHVTGWRRHRPMLGCPDFVFASPRIVVFVDGCFWHRCPNCFREPKSNFTYWTSKIQRNTKRDRLVNRELRKKGWAVIRYWECRLGDEGQVIRRLNRMLQNAAKCEHHRQLPR